MLYARSVAFTSSSFDVAQQAVHVEALAAESVNFVSGPPSSGYKPVNTGVRLSKCRVRPRLCMSLYRSSASPFRTASLCAAVSARRQMASWLLSRGVRAGLESSCCATRGGHWSRAAAARMGGSLFYFFSHDARACTRRRRRKTRRRRI